MDRCSRLARPPGNSVTVTKEAGAFGAEGVVVRTPEDLDALADWAARPAAERPFLVLDLRISGAVVAPYQEEIIRVNS